jgi:hypothetical protein
MSFGDHMLSPRLKIWITFWLSALAVISTIVVACVA